MALEMRGTCERCEASLGPLAEAYVCSYECTFCPACSTRLAGVCPNCGGELVRRPRRLVRVEADAGFAGRAAAAVSAASGDLAGAHAGAGAETAVGSAVHASDAPGIAPTPRPPYYAVTFTSFRTAVEDGYAETVMRMATLAAQQPGYLGLESARVPGGLGLTVSYWRSLDDIHAWKAVAEHRRAQQRGRDEWYRQYKTRVSHVEYDYGFAR